jgi:hypothetical protein
VAASRSTEPRSAQRRRYERLATLGALICGASLVLPWYRIRSAGRFEKSGLGTFGFAEAALLITLGAALVLIAQVRRGRRPPMPMHEGTLLTVAGLWSALIVGYLMVDRPEATIFDFPTNYGLRYGIFIALGGAAMLAFAGLRIRRFELAGEAAERVTRAPAEAARNPTSAPRTRPPR